MMGCFPQKSPFSLYSILCVKMQLGIMVIILNSERQHTDITLLSENKSADKIGIGGPDVNLILF